MDLYGYYDSPFNFISTFWAMVEQFLWIAIIFLVVQGIIALIYTFLGYKLLRIWQILYGIRNGALVFMLLWMSLGMKIHFTFGMLLGVMGLLLGAGLGGYVGYRYPRIGTYLLCFNLSISSCIVLFGVQGVVLGIFIGMGVAYLSTLYPKPIVILMTAIGGGLTVGGVIGLFSGILGFIVGLALILAGIYAQCITNGNVFGIGTGRFEWKPFFDIHDTIDMGSADFRTFVGAISTNAGFVNKELCSSSKIRTDLSKNSIKVKNDREYYFPESPIVLPQVQIGETGNGEQIGIYLSIQNLLPEKRVVACVFDIHCYNVLKEKLEVLQNVELLDLSIETGQIVSIENPILLPNNGIRKCEIVPRYIVFSDEVIWKYEGDKAFELAPVQEKFSLDDETSKRIFNRYIQPINGRNIGNYSYMPKEYNDFWYCGCGQLNISNTCVCCHLEKNIAFQIVRKDFLLEWNNQYIQEQDRNRFEREQQIHQTVEDMKTKTKNMLEFASEKGKDVVDKVSTHFGEQPKENIQLEEVPCFEETYQEEVYPEIMTNCTQCGEVLKATDSFCSSCGTPNVLQEKPVAETGLSNGIYCPNCGTSQKEDSIYCMECGKRL